MENFETLQSHVLRALAQHLRLSASLTVVSWYSNKMLDSAIELEAQAASLEFGSSVPRRAPTLLSPKRQRERRGVVAPGPAPEDEPHTLLTDRLR